MRTLFYKRLKVKLGIAAFVLLFCNTLQAQTQDQSSIGVFQFVATTIDVVGLEDDVSYIVRNELRKAPNVEVINQRELEIALTRNDIEQKYSAAEAIKAASILNLNYVIIGEVSRNAQQIVANVDLVSPMSSNAVGSLKFTFSNQAQIALQANYIGSRLAELIAQHKLSAKASAENANLDWVEQLSATYSGGLVTLKWQMLDPSAAFLGFNIYRADNETGPFSYIASEAELEAKDSVGSDAGTYFYQLSMINDEGEEIRSQKLASVLVQAQTVSSLDAPTIVKVTERVNGIAFEFFPSADNISKNVVAYELLRRADGEEWQVVGGHTLAQNNSSNQSNRSSQVSIEKLSVFDTQADAIDGTVYYAIRAVSSLEKGQLTKEIAYTPASPPSLQLGSNASLREIQLAWEPATAGFGYKLYRRLENESDWLLITELPNLQSTRFTDTDIQEEGKQFEYAISVFDDFGETQKSASLLASSKTQLAPPTQVVGVSGLARKATITWQVNTDPDVKGYSIFRAPFTEDKDITLSRVGEVNDPLATSFTDESVLQDNTQYYYSVASINKYNSSGAVSKAVLINTKALPTPLQNLQAQLFENAVQLNWVLPAQLEKNDATSIVLERSYNGQTFEKLAKVPITQSNYTDTSLLAGANLWYRAQIIDNDGLLSEAIVSEPLKIDLPLTLSVPNQGLLRKISLAWQHASAPAQIKIYRGSEQQHLALVAELSQDHDSTYIDEDGLVDDQTYFVKIESWLMGNKIAESNVVSSTTKNIPAPQKLMAESNIAKRIALIWDAVEDESIEKYVIFRKDLADPSSQLVSIAQTDSAKITEFVDEMFLGTSLTQTGKSIEHGKQYEYAIASKNVFGATGFIGKTVVANSKPLPAPPSNINTASTQSDISLSWNLGDENDLENVVIERKWPFENDFVGIAKIAANSQQYTDQQLYPYARPEYRLSVIDADGLQSTFTKVTDVANKKAIVLQVVQDKLLRKIQLAWQSTGNNTEVLVNRRKLGETVWHKVDTLASNITNYTNSEGLVDQTEYEYQLGIQTLNPSNFMLGVSNAVQAATKDLPIAPVLQTQSNLVKSVELSWQASTDQDVAGYHLYKITDDGKLDKLDTFSRNEAKYTDDGSFFSKLENGTSYSYKIASFNTFNVEGLHSEIVSATTKRVPQAPTGLNAVLSGTNIAVKWTANQESDIARYEVYRGNSCSRVSLLGKTSSDSLAYTDTSAKPSKEYCFKIKAIDTAKLESELSAGVQITTPEASE